MRETSGRSLDSQCMAARGPSISYRAPLEIRVRPGRACVRRVAPANVSSPPGPLARDGTIVFLATDNASARRVCDRNSFTAGSPWIEQSNQRGAIGRDHRRFGEYSSTYIPRNNPSTIEHSLVRFGVIHRASLSRFRSNHCHEERPRNALHE